jgi:hypothetical protein
MSTTTGRSGQREEPVRTCCEPRPHRERAVPVVTVITSVWDIHRLCECKWLAPDYAAGVRTWTRIPDPSCPYCIRSAASRAWATPIGVAA